MWYTSIDMPNQLTVLRVFAASPSELSEERALLDQVISELNNVWSSKLGLWLQLIRWETHAYPGVGADAQEVVNEEIGDDYEIFVGLMWTRFGTATGRAASGTEEEFERAYSRYKEDKRSVRVMFYFRGGNVD